MKKPTSAPPLKLEEEFLALNKEIYEHSFRLTDVVCNAGECRIRLRRPSRARGVDKVVEISPVSNVLYKLPHETMRHLVVEKGGLIVTNVLLMRRYVEESEYSVLLEGWPRWTILITIKENRFPVLRLKEGLKRPPQ